MARRWHPDRFAAGSPIQREAEERMKRINAAYERLRPGAPLEDFPEAENEDPSGGYHADAGSSYASYDSHSTGDQQSGWKRGCTFYLVWFLFMGLLRSVGDCREEKDVHRTPGPVQERFEWPRTPDTPAHLKKWKDTVDSDTPDTSHVP